MACEPSAHSHMKGLVSYCVHRREVQMEYKYKRCNQYSRSGVVANLRPASPRLTRYQAHQEETVHLMGPTSNADFDVVIRYS